MRIRVRAGAMLVVAAGAWLGLGLGQPAVASAGSSGGVLTYGTLLTSAGSSQQSLDPATSSGSPLEAQYNNLIYDVLLRYGPSGSGLYLPGLAKTWTVPNATTIVLRLQQGVKFQDGTPFNAAAVSFNLQRDATTPNPYINKTFQQSFQSAQATGNYLVTIHLSQPTAGAFLPLLAQNFGWIASPSAVRSEGSTYAQHPVGAGPYRLTTYEPGQQISVRRWSGFWQKNSCRPYSNANTCWRLGGVDFIQTATNTAGTAALLSGQIDYTLITEAGALAALQHRPNISVLSQPSATGPLYMRVCPQGPFANPLVRKAVALAIDRPAINQVASNGTDATSSELWPPGSPFYSPKLAKGYQPALAQKLIRQAHASGATFTLMFPAVSNYEAIAPTIQAQLKNIGLNPVLDGSTNLSHDLLIDKGAPAGLLQVIAPGGPPKLQPLVAGELANWCGFSNSTIDAAYQTLESGTASQAQQVRIWQTQINPIVAANNSLIALLTASGHGAYDNTKVGGVRYLLDNGAGGTPNFQTMFLKGS